MTELEHFRAQKDAFFKTHPQSPLTAEQQANFTGLRYFPENPELRLVLPLNTLCVQGDEANWERACLAESEGKTQANDLS